MSGRSLVQGSFPYNKLYGCRATIQAKLLNTRVNAVFRHWPGVCYHRRKDECMRTLLIIILWFILLTICWPLALIALLLFPLIWLILLPFRIIGFTLELVFKIIGAILLFPFRLIKAI